VLKVADVVAERFSIERFAGSGGMGQVFRAIDRVTGEPVALKVMSEANGAERFLREARLLADLHHPGIVRYVAHGVSAEGQSYIAMEWAEGETLAARLRRSALPDHESLALVTALADALSAAHARGVVHRDVKPANIILVDGMAERVKILDFGIAHLEEGTALVTRTGAVLGTVGYMAPEQAKGVAKVDARADVFALGAVLFHCLIGRAPFAGGPAVAVLAKLVLDEAPRLRSLRANLPADLDQLVAEMLAKEPRDRPSDGAAVVERLRSIELRELATRSGPVETSEEALTGSEQRLVSVLLASGVASDEASEWGSTAFETLGTQPSEQAPERPTRTPDGRASGRIVRELRQIARNFGARLEPLRSGAVAVMLSGATGTAGGSATDLVVRAARSALALRSRLPEVPMALATGRGIVAGAFPVGEVIERAAELLDRAPADGVGIALDSVTAGLLDARFEMAGDAKHALLLRERPQGDVTRKLLGRPTSTVGRERELGYLTSVLDECIEEPIARVVLVSGPAGVGKSRVRYEFLRRVDDGDRQVEVWATRGDPLSAGSPFGLLAQAIRRAAQIHDGEEPKESREKMRARVARHAKGAECERIAAFLGEIARVSFAGQGVGQLDDARRDPVLMGDQMRRAFEDFVLAECSAHPVLLVIEDLHWGDLPTVSYVDSALRVAKESPFMVLALARPDVREQFPSLWEQRELAELRLGTLTRRASEKLVREVLGKRADAATVQRIVERADGNAFYLEELIRTVAEGELDALPETVLAMVQSRLEALPDGARRVLRAASVLGGVFWHGAVTTLVGVSRDTSEVDDWLTLLAEREIVTPRGDSRFPGTSEYVFRHALVREAAYAMLTPEDRERGHRLAGAWLEENGEPDALLLAQHFELGGQPGRALTWCRTAAEEAMAGNDLDAAHKAILRARGFADATGLDEHERGKLDLLEAEILYWLARHREAEGLGLSALERLGAGSDLWFYAAELTTLASHHSGDAAREVEMARLLLEGGWCEKPGVAGLKGCLRVAVCAVQIGEFDLAEEIFSRVDTWAADQCGSPAAAARWQASLAVRALYSGRTLEYSRHSRAAALACEEAGDFRSAALHHHNVGHAWLELGAYADAERELRGVMALAQRLGLANVEAAAMNNLGAAIGRLERLDEAKRLLLDAIQRLESQSDLRMEGGARNHLAEVCLALGDFPAATAEAERAVAVLGDIPPLRIQARGTLARALLASDNVERALAEAETAHRELEKVGSMADGEAGVRLACAEALARAGQEERARKVLTRAKTRLVNRAEAIDDESARTTFLECVAENARTLRLAREWGI
jgi:eukaryotic-like serine/threonine-protein kinase